MKIKNVFYSSLYTKINLETFRLFVYELKYLVVLLYFIKLFCFSKFGKYNIIYLKYKKVTEVCLILNILLLSSLAYFFSIYRN